MHGLPPILSGYIRLLRHKPASSLTLRLHNLQSNLRSILPAMKHLLRSLHEVGRLRHRNIFKLLRIQINQRKPSALYLQHDPMARPERMANIRHDKFNLGRLVGDKRLRLSSIAAILSAKRLASNHLLIPAHLHFRGVRVGIRIIVRININQLYDEVGVGPRS